MKRTITTIFCAAVLGMTNMANAQSYEVGTNVLSLGVGLGSSIGYTNSSQSPALSIQFEHGITELGSGVVSIGGYVGLKTYKYEWSGTGYHFPEGYYNYTYTQKWNYTIIGLRGAYHFTGLDVDKVDLYGGVMLSYNILSYKYSDTDPYYSDSYYNYGTYGSAAGFSIYGGGRYFFTDNIGAFLELGYGISYLNLGLSFKF